MEATQPQAGLKLLPPRPDVCQVCAADHRATQPHNAQSMYYQFQFKGRFGRWATWADAIAHCEADTRDRWRAELVRLGRWTEPPAGEDPIDQPHRLGTRGTPA